MHSASYVGYDPELCTQVNVDGTALLVEEAVRAGVSEFVYMSTSAVYGPGPHRGAGTHVALDTLASVLSQSRRDAERIVLEAGGRVVRPALVLGNGDTWVVPSIIRVVDRLGGVPEGGRSRQSVVNVRDLAELMAALVVAVRKKGNAVPKILNAANSEPMTVSEILRTLAVRGVKPPASLPSIPLEEAERIAPAVGLSAAHVRSFAVDNWVDASHAWSAAELHTPADLGLDDGDVLYYKSFLRP